MKRPLLSIVTRPASAEELEALFRRSNVVALLPPAIAHCTRRELDVVLEGKTPVFAVAGGTRLCGAPLAVALFSDYLALEEAMTIDLDAPELAGEVTAGLVWRLNRRALALLASRGRLDAAESVKRGVGDALVAAGSDPVEWLKGWVGGRSILALESAVRLLRSGRSLEAERIEFARLFSTGEPRTGLTAFLRKTKPELDTTVEIV